MYAHQTHRKTISAMLRPSHRLIRTLLPALMLSGIGALLAPGAAFAAANVTPRVVAGPSDIVKSDGLLARAGYFIDPDPNTWSATVDYGDGTGVQPLALTGTNFALSHTYSADGTYTVTVSVQDDAGGTGTSTFTVNVNRVLGSTTRVSISSTGTQGNKHSKEAAVSSDGRFVAFESSASNLVVGDTNNQSDIFLYDRQSGTTTRVSVNGSGAQATGASYTPSLSADGRYVAFSSTAANLVAGDTNGQADLFVRDTVAGTITRVSVASDGTQATGASLNPAISADGRYVVFESSAANLVAGDTNGAVDLFMHDMVSGTTTRISIASDSSQANGASSNPAISADGRYVAFRSSASNLVASDTNNQADIFVRDTLAGTTERVSVATDGTEASGASSSPSISADGRYVAFISGASNLTLLDSNGMVDVFVRDRQASTTERVSISSTAAEANNVSGATVISGDGRFVAFESAASNLVPDDTNGQTDIFVYDRLTATTRRVSVDSKGAQATGKGTASTGPDINADGSVILFTSTTTNLVAGDTNSASDIFAYVRTPLPVSSNITPLVVAGANAVVKSDNILTRSGFFIDPDANTFTATADYGDGTGAQPLALTGNRFTLNHTYAADGAYTVTVTVQDGAGGQGAATFTATVDQGLGTPARVSVSSTGVQANKASKEAALSADGRYVAYESSATNLVGGDSNAQSDIFVYDRQTGITTRASVGAGGAQATGASYTPDLSADGRYIVFTSASANLVAGDTNTKTDIFIRDQQAGTTTRVSLASDSSQANDSSLNPAISADGRYVVFESAATNLVAGDTNGQADIFIRDTQSGTTTRVSVASDSSQANGGSSNPVVSADGRYVAFRSVASNLVAGDTNNQADIFVRDLQTGTTTRVSLASDSSQANNSSEAPAISADGRYVAFVSTASNLVLWDTNGVADLFVRDTQTGTTERVSISNTGVEANGVSGAPAVSADGRFVTFESAASTLVPNDTNGLTDIFVYDRRTATIRRISLDANGVQASGRGTASTAPDISGDGSVIAFTSTAPGLVQADTNGMPDIFVYTRNSNPSVGNITPVVITSPNTTVKNDNVLVASGFFIDPDANTWTATVDYGDGTGSQALALTGKAYALNHTYAADGTYTVTVTVQDSAGGQGTDSFIATVDQVMGATARVSVGSAGAQANKHSKEATISADGRYVAFESTATNLVASDTNNQSDIFVYDRQSSSTARVSLGAANAQANGASFTPSISSGGQYVAFASSATNLVAGDTNAQTDIFLRDTQAGTTVRISVASDGTQASGASVNPAISADGRYIAFESAASNLVAGDTNGQSDIFVRDTQTGTTTRVSLASDGTQASGASSNPVISADGRYIAFRSSAANLVAGDTNGQPDIFVRDTQTGTTTLVSLAWDGAQAAGASSAPAISADGRYIAFISTAPNLVLSDTNTQADVFVRDTLAGTTERVSISSAAQEPNGASGAVAISANGRFVTFESAASNLVPNDTNGLVDIFVHDRQTVLTRRISIDSNGAQATGKGAASNAPDISADGSIIVFTSTATNLIGADTNLASDIFAYVRNPNLNLANITPRVVAGPDTVVKSDGLLNRTGFFSDPNADTWTATVNYGDGTGTQALALTGKTFTLNHTYAADGAYPVTVTVQDGAGGQGTASFTVTADLILGAPARASLTSTGSQSNKHSQEPAVSGNGRYVAFESTATNLVASDTNNQSDIFVYDRQSGTTSRVSLGAAAAQANGASYTPAITTDGRYIAFASGATNLVAGDTNGQIDIFVRDTQSGTTTLASVATGGTQAVGASARPAISSDGRYVVFESTATNLVAGDTNEQRDIFLRDTQTGITTRISVATDGTQANGSSTNPVISSDGRYIAFASTASNLVAGDTNGQSDIFVRDTQTGTTTRVSLAWDGSQADNGSTAPAMTTDGRYVAFVSSATNLVLWDTNAKTDIFVRDTQAGTTERVSISSAAAEANNNSGAVAISGDGRFVTFESSATNLRPDDTNGAIDIFVYDRRTAIIRRANLDGSGRQAAASSTTNAPDISADGSVIVYTSMAANLVAADTNFAADIFTYQRTPAAILSNITPRVIAGPDTVVKSNNILSRSGYFIDPDANTWSAAVDYGDGTGAQALTLSGKSFTLNHIYGGDGTYTVTVTVQDGAGGQGTATFTAVVDLALGSPARVSVSSTGVQANKPSKESVISSDGRYVAFESTASNLVTGDTNNQSDIFRFDRQTGAVTRISIASAGTQATGPSFTPSISSDGRYIAFSSTAANLVAGDTNNQMDIFVRDTQTGTTTRINLSTSGTQASGSSANPVISADGRYIAFESAATNLVAGDTNGQMDVFIRDTQTGTTTRVSLASDGTQGNGASSSPAISADGRYVAFRSLASNLVAGDTNGQADIFIRDLQTNITTRVSLASDSSQANGASANPVISANGRYVAFISSASNLVLWDLNGMTDIFVRDTQAGTTERVSISSAAVEANNNSGAPAISADGRFVTFESAATNLVLGDTNGAVDIFTYDRRLATLRRISVDANGKQASVASNAPDISSDGSLIVFSSAAANLVSADTNGSTDIFAYQRTISLGNTPPIVDLGPDVIVGNTGLFTLAKLFIDPDLDTWAATVDYGDGTGPQPVTLTGKNFTLNHTYAAGGLYTVSINIQDNASGVGTDLVKVSVDQTAPTIAPTILPAPNVMGWNNTAVTITFTCDDLPIGVPAPTCPNPVTFSTEGANQSSTVTATDWTGNSTSITAGPVNIDLTAPTITWAPDRVPDANGWYNAPVIASFTCTDALSGIAICPNNITISAEGANQSAAPVTAVDQAGNTTNLAAGPLSIDLTAPATTNNAPAGWVNTDVTLTLTATDSLSGVAQTQYQVDGGAWQTGTSTTLTTTGIHTVNYQSTDVAANLETLQTATVRIDKLAPTSTITLNPVAPDGTNGWYKSAITVTLGATDAHSGVLRSEYSFDGTTWTTYSSPFTISADAIHTLRYRAVDNVGNIETAQQVTLKLDQTTPTTTDDAPVGWVNTDVTLTFTATDSLSGVAQTAYQIDGGAWQVGSSTTLTTDGIHTINYQSTDNAGNVEAVKTATVQINKSAPITNITLNPASPDGNNGWYKSPVTVTLSATPSLAGLDHTEYSFNGVTWTTYSAPFIINTDGQWTLSYRSIDPLGNTEPTKQANIKLDQAAPTTTDNAPAGWVNTDVTLTLTPSDSTSGVAQTQYQVDGGAWQSGSSALLTTTGVHTVNYQSTDVAGNVEGTKSATVRIDKVMPTTTATLNPVAPNGTNGWYTSAVTVTLGATDAHSGVLRSEYSFNGTTWTTYTGAFNISTDANWTLYYRSVDNAGNTETALQTSIKLDQTAPVTTDNSPASWQNTSVTLTLSPTDNLSGVSLTQYQVDGGAWQSGTSTVISTSANHTVNYKSTDMAGNVEGTKTVAVKIDLVAPPTPAAPTVTTWQCRTASLTWTAVTDALSGVVSYNIYRNNVLIGSSATTSYSDSGPLTPATAYSYAVTAVDAAGNESAKSTVGSYTAVQCATNNSVSVNTTTQAITTSFTISAANTYVKLQYTIKKRSTGQVVQTFTKLPGIAYAAGTYNYVATPSPLLTTGTRYDFTVDLFYDNNNTNPSFTGGTRSRNNILL